MNLTSQYVANPKSREVYLTSLAMYKAMRPSNAKLRLGDDRQILNDKKKYNFFEIDDIKFKMIQCPRGTFTMGASDLSDNPKRTVSINKPFLLGETEVTQELFEKVMGFNPSGFQGQRYPNSNKKPVEQVSSYDAMMFCNKLSTRLGKEPYYNITNEIYGENDETKNITNAIVTINPRASGFRLPHEKEWEYAAKAGTNNQWAGANAPHTLGEFAWFRENSKINGESQTHPVKGKRPNEWGFYDMIGNVYEWCWDEYDEYSAHRVARGGSWYFTASLLRSAFRDATSPGTRISAIGFRVSASLFN